MKQQRLVLIAFIVSTILAGNNAIGVRFSNVELPPFFGAGIRFTAASLLLFLAVLALRLPLPRNRALAGTLIYGALQYGVSYALIYWSLVQVQAGLFQVILALVPLFTFLFAVAHRQESFQWRILVGGLVAVAGIAVIFGDRLGANIPLTPLFAIVLAAACIAEASVLFKTFPRVHPITTNAFAMGVGAVILLVMSWIGHETVSLPTLPATWVALLYLILLGSIATFVLFLYVLSHWTASASSYQLVLMPIVTVLSASWLAHETVDVAFLVGGALVLTGVYIGALASPGSLKKIFARPPSEQRLTIGK